MASVAPAGAQRFQQHDIQSINHDNYQKCVDFIVSRTGMPPASYEHLYGFKTHLDKFIHPNPQHPDNRRNRVTPLGLGSDRIPEQLMGWENTSDEQKDTYHQIFNRYDTDELQTAFDRFFQRQGRRPTVDEFSRYLLTLEGNNHQDTSRKTLGNLFLESEEQKRVIEDNLNVIGSLNEMMASKDVMNNTLSEAYSASLAEIEGLKVDKDNYQAIVRILQREKQELNEKYNMLAMDLNFERSQNDDLRGDKIRLDESCKELNSCNAQLESQNVQLESQNAQLESQNVQLMIDITDVRSELALVENQLKMVDDAVVMFTRLLADVEIKLTEAEGNVESLLNENGSLKEKLTNVKDDNFRLQQTLDTVTDDKLRLQQTLDTVTDDKLRLQQTLDIVTDDNQKLTDDKFRLQQTLDTVTDDKFRLQQTLDTVTDDKFRLQQTLDTVTDDNQKLTDVKFRLQQTLDTVTDDKFRLQQTLDIVTDDNQKLTDVKFRLQQTLDTVTDDKFRLQQTLDTVTDDNQKLTDDNQKLTDVKFRLQQTLDTVTDDYSRLEKGVSKLEQEKAHLDRQLLFFKSIFVIVILGFILTAFNFRSLEQLPSS